MAKKQKILIASIVAVVLIFATIGIVLLANGKKEDKSSNIDKVSVTDKVEKENKQKEDKLKQEQEQKNTDCERKKHSP